LRLITHASAHLLLRVLRLILVDCVLQTAQALLHKGLLEQLGLLLLLCCSFLEVDFDLSNFVIELLLEVSFEFLSHHGPDRFNFDLLDSLFFHDTCVLSFLQCLFMLLQSVTNLLEACWLALLF